MSTHNNTRLESGTPEQDTNPYIPHNIKEYINLATHNIRGLNNLTKLHSWIDYCIEQNLHIIALSETKLKESSPIALTNCHYKIYTSNFIPTSDQNREASLGSALLVHNTIQPYIHSISTYPGTAICIDFYFPGNRTRIISTYLPSNHPDLLTRTQKQISLWIYEAKQKNWHTIIMGDFNANANAGRKRRLPLFTDLNTNNLTSLLNFHEITDPTWSNNTSSSQIDDIWASPNILLDFDRPVLTSALGISDSDHVIISSTWHTNFSPKVPRNKKRKRKIYCYDKMTKEKWEDFANNIRSLLTTTPPPRTINNIDQINKSWHIWSSSLKQAANTHIPFTYTAPRPFHALSLKSTNLHNALKHINKCRHALHCAKPPDTTMQTIQRVNSHLNKALSLAKMPKFSIMPTVLNYSAPNNNSNSALTKIKKIINDIKTTIWTCRNVERNREQTDRIKYYTNRRYTDFKDNTHRMINSILKRDQDKINYDKVITADSIITDPTQIKEAVSEHFRNWTKANPTDTSCWEEWQPYYAPQKNIHPTTYEPLLEPFTLEELTTVINEAPKNKATGPNGISNELIQHIPAPSLDILLQLFNACLRLEQVPKQWLAANIWAIPKKERYDNNLNNTRPITLIDHSRKLFTKLLTNRLSNILLRHQILSSKNHAALPFQSTLRPISELTSIIEHANTNKKELWLLLQDMSKAFDSIHIPMLTKALERIRIPQPIINLLTYILTHRNNRIITTLGLTPSYAVEDGIDQGETISPLLWRIYYDPLITRIYTEHNGYEGTIPSKPSPKTIHTSIMAYMDDSLWIAPSKEHLEKILTTANSFYKLNRIKVNPNKSTLITNSRTVDDKTIIFDGHPITSKKQSEPIKYLGAWFCLSPNILPAQKLILAETKQCINKMQHSIITGKQAIYIINNVIIPRLSYRLYSTYLKPGQINSLTKIYTNLTKNKAKLSRGIPNSFLFHPEIYALKPLAQIQAHHLSTTFLRNINHPEFDNSFLKIRLQELQDSSKSNQSILQDLPLLPLRQTKTYTAQTVLTLHSLNISMRRHTLTDWPITCDIKGTSINEILQHHPSPHLMKEKLNLHNISSIEQFLDSSNSNLLDWNSFHHNIQKIPPGRIPRWFTETQELIRATANPASIYTYPNPYTLTKWTPKKKTWAYTLGFEIGKINRIKNNIAYVRHYTRTNNVLTPCLRCHLKEPTISARRCYFSYNNNGLFTLQVSSKKIIHALIPDIIHALQLFKGHKNSCNTPQPVTLPRPLNIFSPFPRETWEAIEKINHTKRKVTVHLLTTSRSQYNQN